MLSHEVVFVGFLLGGRLLHGPVNQINDVRQSVPHNLAGADGHVDPGTSQFTERHRLNAFHPPGGGPHGPRPQEMQYLGYLFPVGAETVETPKHHSHVLGIPIPFFSVLGQQGFRQLDAHLPGRPRRNRMGIDAVEITARRQDIDLPPCHQPGWARRNITAVHGGQQSVHLPRHPVELAREFFL